MLVLIADLSKDDSIVLTSIRLTPGGTELHRPDNDFVKLVNTPQTH